MIYFVVLEYPVLW